MTLRALLADPAMGLVAHFGGEVTDRPVSWVHGSELLDPTPFLTGGELLLTTGLCLPAEDAGECRAFVRRLADADVAGLGFGVGLSHARVPAVLADAATEAGLPLIEVPRQTPFIAISKAVSMAVAAEQYAALVRTSQAQRELARAAVTGPGPAGVVRRLAHLVDGWVLLLDAAGQVIHAEPSRAADRLPELRPEVDRLRRQGGPASTAFACADAHVWAQTLGNGARWVLAVGRPLTAPQADQHLVHTAAALLTMGLARSHAVRAAHARLHTGLFRLLLAGQTELVREAAGDVWGPLPAPPVRVFALAGTASARRAALDLLDAEAARSDGPALVATLDGTVLVLAGADGAAADRVSRLPERVPALRVGVSEPVDYGRFAEGHRQATQAAAAAVRHDRPVTGFADLAGAGVLSLLPADAAGAFAESLLAPLVRHDREHGGTLLASLRVWLEQLGQWDPAAARLGVHRHTLRNRMRRVEQLTGRGLDSPGVRAELWLALQLLPTEQERAEPG
ncbi:PucR family transcriptional regulator [Solihabitans fulvus]|uniref:PucR family transcriptional regulator n=1 Tax=Solihabitans fulvus TaxID=1892852 RepID=A0A5B2XTG5_9PSEU|nr:PucR family transcriptional regulator [Solihabitans fulvus]KAA2267208.1 PucR family transcriptional regulator [Solihabitans fulvus]